MAAMVANVCFESNAQESPPRTADRAMRGKNRWYATRINGVIDGERIAKDARTLTRDTRARFATRCVSCHSRNGRAWPPDVAVRTPDVVFRAPLRQQEAIRILNGILLTSDSGLPTSDTMRISASGLALFRQHRMARH